MVCRLCTALLPAAPCLALAPCRACRSSTLKRVAQEAVKNASLGPSLGSIWRHQNLQLLALSRAAQSAEEIIVPEAGFHTTQRARRGSALTGDKERVGVEVG